MVEKVTKTPHEDLICPLCLDIFEDATLLNCEHTFCRRCLVKCDESQRDSDHLTCPLCRSTTKLPETRVPGLSRNRSIAERVDEYTSSLGGLMALLDAKQTCSSCNEDSIAVSFCKDCDVYMCECCHKGHRQMRFLFAKHRVASLDDGEVVTHRQSDRCVAHELQRKDLFCETCTVHVCLKCVVVDHRGHVIKNQEDFEKDIQEKINDISQQCSRGKNRIKENIRRIEQARRDMHGTIQNLEGGVLKVRDSKLQRLQGTQNALVENLRSVQGRFDEELDMLKANQRKRVKTISSLLSLVMVDRLKNLEGDSFSAHSLACEDLQKLLKETDDVTIAVDQMKKAANGVEFCSVDERLLDLGYMQVGMRLVRELDVAFDALGMAALSTDAVVLVPGGGGNTYKSYFLSGREEPYLRDCIKEPLHDLTILADGRPVVSRTTEMCSVYSTSNDTSFNYTCKKGRWDLRLCRDHRDNVYAVNKNPEVYIFSGEDPNPRKVVPIKINAIKVAVTTTGVIITGTCIYAPSTIHVYDTDGHLGSSIQAEKENEYLYAAVDSHDRVLVARVEGGSKVLRLARYRLVGVTLIEDIRFRDLKLPHKIGSSSFWNAFCCMVSLTPKLVAIATRTKHLYFIELGV
ncbi:tripartite motif-containing protein 45-like [Lytechinus variegatus]|uniref:tripartite motif-containing protein 45-like n=1 Tax=Lytechinus variegatus TaxID=7654 RepID=UPI001BB28DFD|nr:tripartite motif-containing protein 45-like [Lytechinus variegatus]